MGTLLEQLGVPEKAPTGHGQMATERQLLEWPKKEHSWKAQSRVYTRSAFRSLLPWEEALLDLSFG